MAKQMTRREFLDQMCDRVKKLPPSEVILRYVPKYRRSGSDYVCPCPFHNGKHYSFRIADTGIGIPEEALDRIFERFYRVDKSRAREVGGTGLGLSLARSVITLHRGTVSVVSEVGEGSEFKVMLPLKYGVKNAAI